MENKNFRIQIMNHIAERGIASLVERGCTVGKDVPDPQGILLRSADLHDYPFGESLLVIARSGAGTNNIPLDQCCDKGIVVFNSPGANAEAVKELIICSMVMSSRDVLGSIDWVKSLKDKGDEIPALVEKGKAAFSGPELTGKTLGVIGLGAIGSQIANIAVKLGMNVIGFDPYLSVDAAWRLSRSVQHAVDVDEIFIKSDYISINVPFTESTKHMLDAAAFRKMKQGVRVINESRAEVVDDDAMLEALASGKVGKYITDFPNKKLIGVENVICMPHLGACTPESEERSSVMAAHEMYDYLVNGNIKNSVNFPDATLERMGTSRLCILHFNKPTMLNQFLQIACSTGLNVENMINKAYRDYAYAMIDLNGELDEEQIEALRSIPDVIRVRVV